ncbi:MAG: glutathione-disulfide reductase [Gammaproteobacteria bacterium]|nr:glutathione-disulfide reductase [Gammaproteobacteria bacterium]
MSEYDYDLFVIGAGSGGVRAARMSGGFGAKVAIAEDRYLGGTCVNVGCIPKKLFVYAAHYAEDFNDAAGYGWQVSEPVFDWSVLLNNKNTEIKRLNGIYKNLLKRNNVVLYNGRAVIEGPNTVRVNGESLSARRILVATGGWPHIPNIPGREHVISSNEAFFLDTLPASVVIVGGGYIAVEFAGIFHGLGVDTTLVYRGDLFLRGFDGEMREFLAEQMHLKGIKLLFNSRIDSIEQQNGRYLVNTAGTETITADLVMYATGRRPNTDNLGLETAGVELNEKGAIRVDDEYRSSVPSIYAIGDVTDHMNLTPVATAEGTALANNLFNNQSRRVDYRDVPTCIFSQPNLGTVGLTEQQARQEYANVEIYKSRFTSLKHTLTGSSEKTLMKIIVDKDTDKVLGVHMVGPDAGEIIQGIGIALKAGATKATFDATIGIHPTAAEEFVTMREPAG